MSGLFERFAQLPDLRDPREEAHDSVLQLVDQIQAIHVDTLTELIATIDNLNIDSVYNRYANSVRNLNSNNRQFRRRVQGLSFRQYKAIIGALNYV